MDSMEIHSPEIGEWVDEHADECIEFLQDLVGIPSATTAGEDEEAVAKRIREEMGSLGFDRAFIDDFGNVHGVIEGSEDGVVMLNSHIDTVGYGDREQWEVDPYAGDIIDGEVYGLGSADMKCAMAAMVYAGGALAALDITPKHDLYVTGELFEEVHEGYAMRYVDQETDIDLRRVVIGEASEMNVKRGHRGRCELKIEVEGRSCHASAPDRGINAMYHASKIIDRLEELAEETEEDDFLGRGTIAVTNVEVDTPSNNAVPAAATVYVDRRLTTGEDEQRAHDELQEAINAAIAEYGDEVTASYETLTFDRPTWTGYQDETPKYYPTWALEEDHPLVTETHEIVDSILEDVEVTKWTFSTSGVYTMGYAGIPTIGFGPSEEQWAHAPNERVAIENVVRSVEVYAHLGRDL